MFEQNLESPFAEIALRDTTDEDGACLRRCRVFRTDEPPLTDGNKVAHFLSDVVPHPDYERSTFDSAASQASRTGLTSEKPR